MSGLDGPTSDLWVDLRRRPADAVGRFAALELRLDGEPTGLFMAIGYDQRLHLFIPLADEDGGSQDIPMRLTGFEVHERRIIVTEQREPSLHLDVNATPSYEPMFTIIAREIAEAIVIEHRDPRRAVVSIIRRWKAFWRERKGDLDRQEQLGLFGELWVLGRLLIPRCGTAIVRLWRGPDGQRHDFQGERLHIEVKATERREPIYSITGLDQLEQPQEGSLAFVAIQVREESTSSDGLVPMYRECERLLEGEIADLDLFRQRVADAGYDPAYEEEWDRMRLRVESADVYLVDDDFPHLTRENLFEVSAGILRIRYDIDLSTALPLEHTEVTELVLELSADGGSRL